MIYFSVPADFELETLQKMQSLNESSKECHIREVYGQITIGDIQSSGRLTGVLPAVDREKFEQYVKEAMRCGIAFNYTLNPSCYGNREFSQEGIKQISKLLRDIWDMGVRNLTIASPALIEIVKATHLAFEIKASAICEINSPTKAAFYKKLGVNRLVVDADITREFDKLGNLCKTFGDGVEVIVNNMCRKNCAYKMFHYNHEAHCTSDTPQTIVDYYANRCLMENTQDMASYIKMCWVRPEDLHFYESCGIRNFKVQGRQNIGSSDLIKTLQAYFERNYEGNLYELITLFSTKDAYQQYIDNKKLDGFLDKFYQNPGFCHDVCSSCGYCLAYAKKCIDDKKAERIKSMSKRIVERNDQFTQVLQDKNVIY